jgi:phosphatidate cytidylyltransferase
VLRTRLLTAAVALPAVLAAILFLPAWGFALFIALVALWGIYEVAEMTGRASGPPLAECLVVGIASALYSFFLAGAGNFAWAILTAAFLVMLFPVVEVESRGVDGTLAQWNGSSLGYFNPMRALALAGACYTGLLFPYFALLRNSTQGIDLLILMLLLVVCTDSGAYFTGRAVGRHKLALRVSPGKTVEGAIGGIVASVIAGLILRGWLVPKWTIEATAGFAAIVAVLAIIGDLINSAFKRIAGVKDSGWVFPGHGGLLDRTCSLVLAAVLTYYYSR